MNSSHLDPTNQPPIAAQLTQVGSSKDAAEDVGTVLSEAQVVQELAYFRRCLAQAGPTGSPRWREVQVAYQPFVDRRLALLRTLRAGARRPRGLPAPWRVSRLLITTLLVASISACAPHRSDGTAHTSGPDAIGIGLAYLVLSPLLIAAGLIEGIAMLPYFLAADLHNLNHGLVESGAQVSLDETYQYAYERPLKDVPADGDTGRVFRHMSEATGHFQRVLRGYGVEEAEQFLLTAVRSADRDGYTLYAVIHRPAGAIRVRNESGQVVTLRLGGRGYYRPHERDADGRPLDVVVDWAGVPRTNIKTQKGQAILLTLAANSVLVNRRSDEYWNAQRRWTTGQYLQVVQERKVDLDRRMGLSS